MSEPESLVADAWRRIESWLSIHDTTGKLALPRGVSSDEIDRAESVLGVQLPADVRASYEQHDGRYGLWLFEEGFLLPLTRDVTLHPNLRPHNVVDAWSSMKDYGATDLKSEPQGPIKNDWWNRRWIPIIDDECGDAVCLDLDPAEGGHIGQVISWWHEGGATHVLADNFAEFLTNYADDLERGNYKIDGNSVVPVE